MKVDCFNSVVYLSPTFDTIATKEVQRVFGKNLRYYRLRKQMSEIELAEKVGLSPIGIARYEKGDIKPDMRALQALADALDIRLFDFLAARNENTSFAHGTIRKSASLSDTQQEFIRECVEEYFSRFMTIVEILGGDVLPDAPACHSIPLSHDPEKDAAALRAHLGFAEDAPIEDLINGLETAGILVYECTDIDDDEFLRTSGFVNGRPFIVLNSNITPELSREAIAHELARLMFAWPENMDDAEVERMAAAIGERFQSGSKSERMFDSRKPVITEAPIEKERLTLFERLMCRAINEGEISVQRGAELLRVPFNTVLALISNQNGTFPATLRPSPMDAYPPFSP